MWFRLASRNSPNPGNRYAVIATACFLLALICASPLGSYLTRLGGDVLIPLAQALDQKSLSESDVALIVIDEKTHRTPPFDRLPEVAWTPMLGEVIDAVDDAGARAIGLDMIFPKTLSSRETFVDYEKSFLRALAKSGRGGRLILSEARLSDQTIEPHAAQKIAIGDGNIHPVMLTPDIDGVVRRHPIAFGRDDGSETASFAAALAKRGGGAEDKAFHINFIPSAGIFNAYRLSDLYDCLQTDRAAIGQFFQNKIVLIGTALDVEDRHLAANRFGGKKTINVKETGCSGRPLGSQNSIKRATTPGVLINAFAVQTLLDGSALKPLNPFVTFVACFLVLAAVSVVFMRLPPPMGAVALVFMVGVGGVIGALGLLSAYLLPAPVLALSMTMLFAALYAYRTLIEGREKRWIRHAFQHYLSPALVEDLSREPAKLELGGETREAVIAFIDMASFTATASKLRQDPQQLTRRLNRFLSTVTDAIDQEHGYVDKYIGDAVMAVWGAPVTSENPVSAAARAVLASRAAIRDLNTPEEGALPDYSLRAGLASGGVVAGNIGSAQRLNYTVVGDPVNRAARLEHANRQYQTEILIDGETAHALENDFLVRSVDFAWLHGWDEAVEIFELIGARDAEDVEAVKRNQVFGEALATFRNREFGKAKALFATIMDDDALSALYCQRCSYYGETAPHEQWRGELWSKAS